MVAVGRFAPSPTGHLHLGSLTTALASYCQAKSQGGRWLVRLEDTDKDRCQSHFADSILYDLERLGLHWDGLSRQSAHTSLYHDALDTLQGTLYACHCSRKTLKNYLIYPRFCLGKNIQSDKIRLCLPDGWYMFFDELQGVQWQNPQRMLGDMVVARGQMISYILACATDDGRQGITQVVRGIDILPMTATQLWLQQRLGLPSPKTFFHLPLLYNAQRQKLSKQNKARPIDTKDPKKLLCLALSLLGQKTDDLYPLPQDELLTQAVARWDSTPLIGKQAVSGAF